MKRIFLITLVVIALSFSWSSSHADFYVISAGSRGVGTEISQLPYTISTSGFYYIKKDLTSTGDGILINADNVTVDIMGFSINGPESGGDGIVFENRTGIEVRNGIIKDFSSGIRGRTDGKANKIIGVKFLSNGGYSINLRGRGHVVKDCIVADCGAYGIYLPDTGNIIINNTVYNSHYYGIVAGPGSIISGNTSYENESIGINVISGCTVIGNTVYLNDTAGIAMEYGNTVINNTAYKNNQLSDPSRGGILVGGDGNLVKNNTCKDNNLNNIILSGSENSIEENLITGSTNGINFQNTGNLYSNNRAAGNATAYANTAGNTNGGGNVSF